MLTGRQASVTIEGDVVTWVANRHNPTGNEYIGWELCRDTLSPPNFPLVHDVYVRDGIVWVEMEYVQGSALTVWDEMQSALVLSQLKAADIFHRDVRIPNIIVRDSGEWCLIDFGWACLYSDVYPAPARLSGECRGPDGPDDDYAMSVIERMLCTNTS